MFAISTLGRIGGVDPALLARRLAPARHPETLGPAQLGVSSYPDCEAATRRRTPLTCDEYWSLVRWAPQFKNDDRSGSKLWPQGLANTPAGEHSKRTSNYPRGWKIRQRIGNGRAIAPSFPS